MKIIMAVWVLSTNITPDWLKVIASLSLVWSVLKIGIALGSGGEE